MQRARKLLVSVSESTATWTSSSSGMGELGGTAVKPANLGSAWRTFDVKAIVQAWVNRTQASNGFILKAQSETLGLGGPRYEPSELVYNGETEVYPKLLVTFGRPSVTLSPPTTIHATGAELYWTAYQDPSTSTADDLGPSHRRQARAKALARSFRLRSSRRGPGRHRGRRGRRGRAAARPPAGP